MSNLAFWVSRSILQLRLYLCLMCFAVIASVAQAQVLATIPLPPPEKPLSIRWLGVAQAPLPLQKRAPKSDLPTALAQDALVAPDQPSLQVARPVAQPEQPNPLAEPTGDAVPLPGLKPFAITALTGLSPKPARAPQQASVRGSSNEQPLGDLAITIDYAPSAKPAAISAPQSPSRPALSSSAPSCYADLQALGAVFKPIEPFITPKGCGISDGVEISAVGNIKISPSAKLSCAYAKRLAAWIKGDLNRTIMVNTGAGLRTVHHYSAYRCSFRSGDKLSEHATGNAFDLAAITTTTGDKLNVLKDWGNHLDWAMMEPMPSDPKQQRPQVSLASRGDALGNAKRAVWYAVTRSACQAFQLVLTPHSNQPHANHLHIDMGRWKQCEL